MHTPIQTTPSAKIHPEGRDIKPWAVQIELNCNGEMPETLAGHYWGVVALREHLAQDTNVGNLEAESSQKREITKTTEHEARNNEKAITIEPDQPLQGN